MHAAFDMKSGVLRPTRKPSNREHGTAIPLQTSTAEQSKRSLHLSSLQQPSKVAMTSPPWAGDKQLNQSVVSMVLSFKVSGLPTPGTVGSVKHLCSISKYFFSIFASAGIQLSRNWLSKHYRAHHDELCLKLPDDIGRLLCMHVLRMAGTISNTSKVSQHSGTPTTTSFN
jgi:hypothetical protein